MTETTLPSRTREIALFHHAEGKGKDSGAYYTPVPLVDFMLQELEDRSPLGTDRRVFDASCGSGAGS